MNVNELNVRKTGLLFFDMLNVYYRGASLETQQRMKPVVDNAVRLMDAARKASIPIFYALANHRPDGESRSMIVTDTDMRLRPWPSGECNRQCTRRRRQLEQGVIEKSRRGPRITSFRNTAWSTFHQTYFDLALRSRGIDTIIVSGGAVDVGVASTVYSARDHDYNIIVVRDACSNSHEDSMAALMNTVFPRMARVRSTDQVLHMIQNRAR